MENAEARGDREREAAVAAFKERQRPSSGWTPRRTEGTDPVGVLAAAVLGLLLLAGLGQLLIGTAHVVLAFFVMIGMTVCGVVALMSAVAVGVEWGVRRARVDRD
jgi:hypothetical protein